jgi:hypothetical protein
VNRKPGVYSSKIANRGNFILTKLNADDRNKLPAKDFAEPEKRAYPIEDKAHARNAKARATQAANSGRMSKAEQDEIDRKADAVLK